MSRKITDRPRSRSRTFEITRTLNIRQYQRIQVHRVFVAPQRQNIVLFARFFRDDSVICNGRPIGLVPPPVNNTMTFAMAHKRHKLAEFLLTFIVFHFCAFPAEITLKQKAHTFSCSLLGSKPYFLGENAEIINKKQPKRSFYHCQLLEVFCPVIKKINMVAQGIGNVRLRLPQLASVLLL